MGDRGYPALELLAAVRPVATFIARLRLDAHLCAPPPPRIPRQRGRPPVAGRRLPTLQHWRDDPVTVWTSVTVPRWYSQIERVVEVVSQAAVCYHTSLPPVPIRWVLIRDPQGKFATRALLCTDLDATPAQILSWFVLRWQMEVTFHAARTHLSAETQRYWSERAIARTTPALLGLFSFVTLLAHDSMLDCHPPLLQTA